MYNVMILYVKVDECLMHVERIKRTYMYVLYLIEVSFIIFHVSIEKEVVLNLFEYSYMLIESVTHPILFNIFRG